MTGTPFALGPIWGMVGLKGVSPPALGPGSRVVEGLPAQSWDGWVLQVSLGMPIWLGEMGRLEVRLSALGLVDS